MAPRLASEAGGGRDTLYGSCLACAKEAGARIAGLLWYQGESDARSIETAESWRAKFEQLLQRFRTDLNDPRLPVAFVQRADQPQRDAADYPGWARVQQAQATLAVSRARMVSAKGLVLKPDQLHLSTASQRIVGKRLATAMNALLEPRR